MATPTLTHSKSVHLHGLPSPVLWSWWLQMQKPLSFFLLVNYGVFLFWLKRLRSFNTMSPVIPSFHFSHTKFLAILTSLNEDRKMQLLLSKINSFYLGSSSQPVLLKFSKFFCFSILSFFFFYLYFRYPLAPLSLFISVPLLSLFTKDYCLIPPCAHVWLLASVFVSHITYTHSKQHLQKCYTNIEQGVDWELREMFFKTEVHDRC